MSKKFSLFSVYGIEAEYMIVDRKTFKIRAIADQILKTLNGDEYCNEVSLGEVSCSNELVNHVLEIKCTDPVSSLDNLDIKFNKTILKLDDLLVKHDCCLLPTAMHPWFDPTTELVLWPHDQRDIYNLYNEIFDCHGHGWSNLQSVHINLPYTSEEEFKQLHYAIRAVLPLVPFLSASSPYYDSKQGPLATNRLGFYEKNQAKVPSIIGNIIPEKVNSTKEYKEILAGIYKDISKYDHAKTLQNPWLNSRAAIPKFDVGAIEIRLMDIQESSYMDLCVIELIVKAVQSIVNDQKKMKMAEELSDSLLRKIYEESKKFDPEINEPNYFEIFDVTGVDNFKIFIQEFINEFRKDIPERLGTGLDVLAYEGNLATRLIRTPLSVEKYKSLALCLRDNTIYD